MYIVPKHACLGHISRLTEEVLAQLHVNPAHIMQLQKLTWTPLVITGIGQILRGVARVPALLLKNPTQQLTSINLEKYEIVASEPLHDVKGHAIHLITELPNILPPGDTKSKCIHLISCCLAKEKKSGADLRRVVIQCLLLLKDIDCSSRVLFLLQSIIKIGEIAPTFSAGLPYALRCQAWLP